MIRLLGASLLVAGCGGFGFCLAAANRRERKMLRSLIGALQEMEWELRYRMTELPELCRVAGNAAGGTLKLIFLELGDKLDKRELQEISGGLNGLIQKQELPPSVRRNMKRLAANLGRFDLESQLQGLQTIRIQCRKDLQKLEQYADDRMRCYQTLALCAGAALAILMI